MWRLGCQPGSEDAGGVPVSGPSVFQRMGGEKRGLQMLHMDATLGRAWLDVPCVFRCVSTSPQVSEGPRADPAAEHLSADHLPLIIHLGRWLGGSATVDSFRRLPATGGPGQSLGPVPAPVLSSLHGRKRGRKRGGRSLPVMCGSGATLKSFTNMRYL